MSLYLAVTRQKPAVRQNSARLLGTAVMFGVFTLHGEAFCGSEIAENQGETQDKMRGCFAIVTSLPILVELVEME